MINERKLKELLTEIINNLRFTENDLEPEDFDEMDRLADEILGEEND